MSSWQPYWCLKICMVAGHVSENAPYPIRNFTLNIWIGPNETLSFFEFSTSVNWSLCKLSPNKGRAFETDCFCSLSLNAPAKHSSCRCYWISDVRRNSLVKLQGLSRLVQYRMHEGINTVNKLSDNVIRFLETHDTSGSWIKGTSKEGYLFCSGFCPDDLKVPAVHCTLLFQFSTLFDAGLL